MKMKKKSIDAATLETAVTEMKSGMVTSLTDYWTGQGADSEDATEVAGLCSEICGLICQTEFSEVEMEDTPPADGTPVSDTPDAAKNILAQMTKAYKEIKAGSTFSGATKGKLKEMLTSATAHTKLVKALHDEAHAVKEESAPEPEKKSIETNEVDYDTWIKMQK